MKRALFIILWLVLLGGLAQAVMALTPPAPSMDCGSHVTGLPKIALPASQGDEIHAASPVNPFGRLEGDPYVFDSVPDGAEIRLERV